MLQSGVVAKLSRSMISLQNVKPEIDMLCLAVHLWYLPVFWDLEDLWSFCVVWNPIFMSQILKCWLDYKIGALISGRNPSPYEYEVSILDTRYFRPCKLLSGIHAHPPVCLIFSNWRALVRFQPLTSQPAGILAGSLRSPTPLIRSHPLNQVTRQSSCLTNAIPIANWWCFG
jgi:hypothetical protein